MLIWMDAWSLAPMILLLAELKTDKNKPSATLQVTFIQTDIRSSNSPFTRDVEVHKFTSVVLHDDGFDKCLPTILKVMRSRFKKTANHVRHETYICSLQYMKAQRHTFTKTGEKRELLVSQLAHVELNLRPHVVESGFDYFLYLTRIWRTYILKLHYSYSIPSLLGNVPENVSRSINVSSFLNLYRESSTATHRA